MSSRPRLIAISDTERAPLVLWLAQLELLLAEASAGSVLVLLRDRQLPLCERRELGQTLRRLTTAHAQLLSVGDRLDLAVLLGADAIHLSEDSVEASDARMFAAAQSRQLWISRACHAPSRAAEIDADALLLSPIAAPRKGRPALGVAGIASARGVLTAAAQPRGLYALGGIIPDNAAEVVAAGADGVALIGALLEPGAPQALIRRLDIAR